MLHRGIACAGPLAAFLSPTALLLTFTASVPAQPAAPSVQVLYYENLGRPEFDVPDSAAGSARAGAVFTFVAFGRQFELLLERDDSLLQRLDAPGRRVAGSVEIYGGRVAGSADSWVRLTRRGPFISGGIREGGQYYALEQYYRVRRSLVAAEPPAHARDLVIYRVDDMLAMLSDTLLVPHDEIVDGFAEKTDVTLADKTLTTLSPGLQVDVGLIADAEMVGREGDETATVLLAMANIMDGIFVRQLGIRLRVTEIVLFDAEPDPFSATAPSSLLDELGRYKLATTELAQLGIAHLFSGRDLDDLGTGSTVGVSNLGTVCDPLRGISATQASNGVFFDAIVAAHEIGHNFGAPHDGEPGSACADAEPGFLMDSEISGNDTFSDCSAGQIMAAARSASCLLPIPASDVSLTGTLAPSEALPDERFTVGFDIDSAGAESAFGVELTIDATGATLGNLLWPESLVSRPQCLKDTQHAACMIHMVAGGKTIPVSIDLTGPGPAPVAVDIKVKSLNDAYADNNELSFSIEIDPATPELAALVATPAASAGPASPTAATSVASASPPLPIVAAPGQRGGGGACGLLWTLLLAVSSAIRLRCYSSGSL